MQRGKKSVAKSNEVWKHKGNEIQRLEMTEKEKCLWVARAMIAVWVEEMSSANRSKQKGSAAEYVWIKPLSGVL